MPLVTAAADFSSPLFWAVLIGWILTVVLHEFAHGLVAHWGGDYTIAERGGLSLNPIQYIDPVFSILMPAIFLAMGGVPLPGGVTYIRMDLVRSRLWQSAVSLAGPAMNVLLFLAGAIALHPKVGWLPANAVVTDWTPGQAVVATLTFLQIYAVILNLIPVPPLDGFGAISPFMRPETRYKLSTPPTSIILLIVAFILFTSDPVRTRCFELIRSIFVLLGYDGWRFDEILMAVARTLYGR